MDNYIQTLNADLARMKELMRSLLPTPSCFEDLLSLYILYKEYNHTDTIIDYAKSVIDSGEDIDQLLADAKAELDTEKRLELYRQAEQILFIDDPAAIFMNDRFNIWVSTDKVEGFVINAHNSIFWDNIRVRN